MLFIPLAVIMMILGFLAELADKYDDFLVVFEEWCFDVKLYGRGNVEAKSQIPADPNK